MKVYFLTVVFLLANYIIHAQGEAGADKIICKGESIQIGGTDDGYCYSWEPASGLTNRNLSNPTVNPTVTTIYKLVVTGDKFEFKRTDEVKITVVDIDLDLSKSISTLCEDITFTAKINTNNLNINNYKFELRSATSQSWYSLSNGSSGTHTRKLKVGGKFKARLTITTDDIECSSIEKDIEVQFPSYSEIISDKGMFTAFTNAWQNTLKATTPISRREEAFWIFYDSKTCSYSAGPTVIGPAISNTAVNPASVDPTPKPNDSLSMPDPLNNSTYVIGMFHTHTPTTYRPPLPGVSRGVGPSAPDDVFNNYYDVVGVVCDYINTTGSIPMGYPLNSPAGLYQSGPIRRTKP